MTIQEKSVNTIRVLSAEAIEKAKSGHPGMCIGAAPIGYEVYADFLNFSYKNPGWDNRDRFVLSAGHASMLLYTLLSMFGFDVSEDDLRDFRQLGSKTAGHPEYGLIDGIETTTGPLGQGIGNAVGFAVAEEHLAAMFNRPGFPVVDHYTYVLCGDGCLEEGIGYEACSFAGAQKLGKLILLYDNNDITIEGDMRSTFNDDTATRFMSEGWQVIRVNDANDLCALRVAIERAKADLTRPSIIICKSVIGYGCPIAGTAEVHGAPIGEKNLAEMKRFFDWTDEPFKIPDDVKRHCMRLSDEKLEAEREWNELFARYEIAYPDLARQYRVFMSGRTPDLGSVEDRCGSGKPEATRDSGGKIINEIAALMPNLMSGSADLAPSTRTGIKDKGNFTPENRNGRNIQFGIREHAMSAICNGIQLHGGLRVICSTFFPFVDYMKGGIRMSAIMNIPVVYVLTHDSIGVGEDGPTHQPVEQLVMLRSTPNVNVYRPCDAGETAAAYVTAFTQDSPTAIVESRQSLVQFGCPEKDALKGAYVLDDCEGTPDVILMGTGSEVSVCVEAKKLLEGDGVRTRVVSVPCMEVFERQSREYRESVLPRAVKARVCVEAASYFSWPGYAGEYGEIVAMRTFGVSGPADRLFEHFGFTPENVRNAAKRSIDNVKKDA